MTAASAVAVPGRELDARAAAVTDRLANHGKALCPVLAPRVGISFQHLTQFNVADRAEQIAFHALDRGPGVMTVVRDSPAWNAGVRPGDVLIAINGVAVPPDPARDLPYAASRAHQRADAIVDLIDAAARQSFEVKLLRAGNPVTLRIAPLDACPAQVHLARSNQRNAFADGRHVFLTTGLLAILRNDDELAFVIAHELAHNLLGHAAMIRGEAIRAGSGNAKGRRDYSVRAMEREADRLGGQLMLAAGYDPIAGVAALSRVDGGFSGLFSVHDTPRERLAAMRALVRSAPASQ